MGEQLDAVNDWSDAPMEPSLKYKTWNHIDNILGLFNWIKGCGRGKGRAAILLGTNAQLMIG